MDHRPLDHALEAGRRLGILASVRDEVGEFAVDVIHEVAAKDVEIDIAGPHDGGRILVIDQGQEKVFEGCVFVAALAGKSEGSVKGLFKTARKARQRLVLYERGSANSFPLHIAEGAGACGRSPSPGSPWSRQFRT